MSKHLGRTLCSCGHQMTTQNISSRIMTQKDALGTNDVNLYGGKVKGFAKARCPECGAKYLLWLKPGNNTYTIITMSAISESGAPEQGEVTSSEEIEIELEETEDPKAPEDMSWNELQKYAKEKGIAVFKKTRDEIIAELNAL